MQRDDRALGDRVAAAVTGSGASVTRDVLEHLCYDGLRFLISTRTTTGAQAPPIDGGAFDWLRITSNHRLTMVASGMGAELAAYLFRPSAVPTAS